MGPVRLFTPYKRRRRNNQDGEEKKPKVRRESSVGDGEVENINQSSNNSNNSKEAWQTIAEGLDTNADYHLLENPDTNAESIPGKIICSKLTSGNDRKVKTGAIELCMCNMPKIGQISSFSDGKPTDLQFY